MMTEFVSTSKYDEINQDMSIWISSRETLTLLHANNKGADQPVHPRSLINTFVYYSLESTSAEHATSKISMF